MRRVLFSVFLSLALSGCAARTTTTGLDYPGAQAQAVNLSVGMTIDQVKAIYGEPDLSEVTKCGLEEWFCYRLIYRWDNYKSGYVYFANSDGPLSTSGQWLLNSWDF